jgi:hypothetical protein
MSNQKALELVIRGSDKTSAWACPICGSLFTPFGPEEALAPEYLAAARAERCCQPSPCACGQTLRHKGENQCSDCTDAEWKKEREEKDQEQFKKAVHLKIEEYDNPVYWEGHSGDYGDGYFSTAEAVLDHCEAEGLEVPLYVWSCSWHQLSLDGDQILEDALEQQDVHEGAGDGIGPTAREMLQAFLNGWTEKENIVSWSVDYSRAVVLHIDAA